MTCFVIAEAGVNHNGSLERASRLIDVAVAAGANAVKFQTFRTDLLVSRGAKKAHYQADRTGEGDQFSMLRQLELSPEAHGLLLDHCREVGIEFMSTPFDEQSADFLAQLGVRRIKVSSGELTNHRLLKHISRLAKPMIVSTGMATLEEVAGAVDVIRENLMQGGNTRPLSEMLTLLHCTSNYPTRMEDVNLRAMHTLTERFRLPVGYSDHTPGILVPPVAVALGAVIVEKHFTLDRSLPGPDHAASLEPAELTQMIRAIRAIEQALGDGIKIPVAREYEVRNVARRSVILARAVSAGDALVATDLALLRPAGGIPPQDIDRVVGRVVRAAFPKGHALRWGDLL